MGKIDFSGLTTFLPEAVNDIRDLIKKEVFMSKSLTDRVTVVNGIEYAKKVGYLTNMGDIGMTPSGTLCALNEINAQVGTEEKSWTPRAYDTRIILCADDVEATLAIKALKKGTNSTDLTDTDYLDVFVDMLKENFIRMFNRMSWMGDMGATRFSDSPAGYYSDTVDGAAFNVKLVTMQYGFFYRFAQSIATVTGNHVDLSTYNNQVSYALQKSTMTSAVALATAKKLTEDLPLDFNYENQYFGCTRWFFHALKSNYQGFDLQEKLFNTENGMQGIRYNGVEFVWLPEWDYMITRYQDSGTAYHNPHRIASLRKDNLLLGVPDVNTWGLFEMFYDKVNRKYYIDIRDKFDTQIMHDTQLAYAV